MRKYRKKPLVIEAIQWDGESYTSEVRSLGKMIPMPSALGSGLMELCIRTLEGDMICGVGDYIIRGIKGEIYPCKRHIFEASYEEVND